MIKPRYLYLLFLPLLLAGCSGRTGLDPRTATFPPLEFAPPEVVRTELSTGLPIYLYEDHDLPLVRVWLKFSGGSLYEDTDKSGLTDLLETSWREGGAGDLDWREFNEQLEDRGVVMSVSLGRRLGEIYMSTLSDELDESLNMLVDLALYPILAPERVEWARARVVDGIRREGDDVSSTAFRYLRRYLYEGHPRAVSPTEKSVGSVTIDELSEFHARIVGTGRWAIGVAGDFNPAEVKKLLEKKIARLGEGDEPFIDPPAPTPRKPRVLLVPLTSAEKTSVVWGKIAPSMRSPKAPPLELGDYLFGGGMQSLLYREIRETRGLAYSVSSFYSPLGGFGVMGVSAQTGPENVFEVATLVSELVDRTGREGFSPLELEEAKEGMSNRRAFRFADPGSRVARLVELELEGFPADWPEVYLNRMLDAGSGAVQLAIKENFIFSDGVLVVCGKVNPDDPAWRSFGEVEMGRLGQ